MTLVPIVTLLFGCFPITLNLPTVAAITAYYTALHCVAYYCKSARQLRALWLANVGTSIMFWPYAKAAALTPLKQLLGRGAAFKATAKGVCRVSDAIKEFVLLFGGRHPHLLSLLQDVTVAQQRIEMCEDLLLQARQSCECIAQGKMRKAPACGCAGSHKQGATLKEIGPSLLLTLLSLLAFAAGLVGFNVHVNAPKAIALCWVLYNFVPHALLLIYTAFGPGRMLRRACSIFCIGQALISLLALALLWLLYPRSADYVKATDFSLQFLFTQWSGPIRQPWPVTWRFSSGAGNVLRVRTWTLTPDPVATGQTISLVDPVRKVDLSGGFYTDGNVRPVKLTVHVAWTTSLLAWSLLEFEGWWTAEPERQARALRLVQHGLEYVLRAYVPAVTPAGWPRGVEAPASSGDVLVYQAWLPLQLCGLPCQRIVPITILCAALACICQRCCAAFLHLRMPYM
jgi:Glycosyl hydrolase family 9